MGELTLESILLHLMQAGGLCGRLLMHFDFGLVFVGDDHRWAVKTKPILKFSFKHLLRNLNKEHVINVVLALRLALLVIHKNICFLSLTRWRAEASHLVELISRG